jgi:hypothetical protein
MKFYLGLFVGVLLGGVVATTWSVQAQLAPVDAGLGESLNSQRQWQTLELQRTLERREHDTSSPRNPCPY